MEIGFVRLSRKFFNNPYWKQKRTFSFAEAWLDLIASARFEGEPTLDLLPNGREIEIKRGEIRASLRFLSERWGWGVDKTKSFIDRHIEKHEIERRTEHGESIIRLCKYDIYNLATNTDTYTDPYTDPYKYKERKECKERKEREEVLPRPPKKFIQPNLEDVTAYCQERKNQINPQQFIDHYEARGWEFKTGQKMKDWRAAVRTWERNNFESKKGGNTADKDDWKKKMLNDLKSNKNGK